MTETVDTPSDPFQIAVLHHRDCQPALDFRRAIFTWFHGDPGDLQSSSGIPVVFRSSPAGDEAECFTSPPLDWQQSQCNLLVLLLDGQMVIDPGWRRSLRELGRVAARDRRLMLCPVVLDGAAYNVPDSVGRVNFLRMDRADDDPDMVPEVREPLRRERLLSLLTQVAARYLLDADSDGVGDPIQLFISHAKGDGTTISRKIRDQVYNQGQIQAFFDESDLPVGHGYSNILDEHAGFRSSALLVVLTDQYASRAWCRREIELARKIRQHPLAQGRSAHLVQPVVVVDALSQGDTRFLSELGQCLVYRWQEDHVSGIIDRVLREVLVHAYHAKYAATLANQPALSLPEERAALCNFLPDPALSLDLAPLLSTTQEPLRLLVPNPGLSADQQVRWRGLIPDLTVESFDEANRRLRLGEYPAVEVPVDESGVADPDDFPLIGISISHSPPGDSASLEAQGCGEEHLQLTVIRLARLLLRHDYNLAYGGDLRPGGFTERLFDLCRVEQSDKIDSAEKNLWTRRMVSFLAWPYYLSLSPEQEGALMNLCRFVKITPADTGLGAPPADAAPEQGDLLACHYLAFMRRRMTEGGAWPVDGEGPAIPPLHARVLLGGKLDGYSGIMPGLMEEALLAWERSDPVPLYILGGFGGVARVLADALLDEREAPVFPLLGLAHHRRRTPKVATLLYNHERAADPTLHHYPARRYQALADAVERVRRAAHGRDQDQSWPGLENGLSIAENRRLMNLRDLTEIEGLLLRGLGRLRQSR